MVGWTARAEAFLRMMKISDETIETFCLLSTSTLIFPSPLTTTVMTDPSLRESKSNDKQLWQAIVCVCECVSVLLFVAVFVSGFEQEKTGSQRSLCHPPFASLCCMRLLERMALASASSVWLPILRQCACVSCCRRLLLDFPAKKQEETQANDPKALPDASSRPSASLPLSLAAAAEAAESHLASFEVENLPLNPLSL